jgi:hypothetical protein
MLAQVRRPAKLEYRHGMKRLGNCDAATLRPGSIPMLEVVLCGAILVAMLFGPPAFVFGLAIREQKLRSIQPN